MKITKIVINSFGGIVNWHSPDLDKNMTLVSGNNEAGKSTIMEFVRGTMFPIRNFKYPVASKTDSGSIEVVMDNGDKRTMIREQKKVREKDGKRTVSEEFSSIDSDTYRALYALDLEQLTNSKIISSGEFRSKFLTVPGGEKVPQVSEDIENRLSELMNKEKMTDSKIIGREIKTLKSLDNEIEELQKNSETYDALVLEKNELQKKINESKNILKLNKNSRERKNVLMSHSTNVDRLNDLKEQRKHAERSKDVPLESKAEYDSLKHDIANLTESIERDERGEIMGDTDHRAVIRRKDDIEYLWNNCSVYKSNIENYHNMQDDVEIAETTIKNLSENTGWNEKMAKNVKSGRYITDKAEAIIKKNKGTKINKPGKTMTAVRAICAVFGIAIAIISGLTFNKETITMAALIAIGAVIAVFGILLPRIIPKNDDESNKSAEKEWYDWITSEGYPDNTTPEKACILATKLESIVIAANHRDECTEKMKKLVQKTTEYEKNVMPLCTALKIEHTNYENDVKNLYDMLKVSESISSQTEELERKMDQLSNKTQALKKFLRKYGTEEDYLEMYDERIILDNLDREIISLTNTIESSAGVPISELTAFYENEGKAFDPEDIDDNTDAYSKRIGEINATINALMKDTTASELLTRKTSTETELNKSIREWAVYSIANTIISNSCNHFYTDLQPSVVKTANIYLDLMTDGRYQLDNDPRNNEITVTDSVMRKSSTQWSSGLGDQVYLSLKMALVKEMGAEKLPLILDDVLVRFDNIRKQGACRAIYEFSKDQQVIMFTCDSLLYNYFTLEGKINDIKLSAMK